MCTKPSNLSSHGGVIKAVPTKQKELNRFPRPGKSVLGTGKMLPPCAGAGAVSAELSPAWSVPPTPALPQGGCGTPWQWFAPRCRFPCALVRSVELLLCSLCLQLTRFLPLHPWVFSVYRLSLCSKWVPWFIVRVYNTWEIHHYKQSQATPQCKGCSAESLLLAAVTAEPLLTLTQQQRETVDARGDTRAGSAEAARVSSELPWEPASHPFLARAPGTTALEQEMWVFRGVTHWFPLC